jgi:nitrogen fixation protein NifU and related proteins
MDLKELYQEIILDHGKNPRNKKKCNNFNRDAEGYNPLCGDKVHVFLKINNNKQVEDISFEGQGCAISMASASIMTETIKGKDFNVAKKIILEFLDMIKQGSKIRINSLDSDQNTTMMSLSGVKQFPMRVKCATLAWHTLMSATDKKNKIKIDN